MPLNRSEGCRCPFDQRLLPVGAYLNHLVAGELACHEVQILGIQHRRLPGLGTDLGHLLDSGKRDQHARPLVDLPRMGNRMGFDHYRQSRLPAAQTLVQPEDAIMVGGN